jgi:hypothetical protein
MPARLAPGGEASSETDYFCDRSKTARRSVRVELMKAASRRDPGILEINSTPLTPHRPDSFALPFSRSPKIENVVIWKGTALLFCFTVVLVGYGSLRHDELLGEVEGARIAIRLPASERGRPPEAVSFQPRAGGFIRLAGKE